MELVVSKDVDNHILVCESLEAKRNQLLKTINGMSREEALDYAKKADLLYKEKTKVVNAKIKK